MWFLRRVTWLFGITKATTVGAVQPPQHAQQYNSGLFSQYEDLQTLSAREYTTLRHPHFPGHSVRVKESRFCDGQVR